MTEEAQEYTFGRFTHEHSDQLKANHFPQRLWSTLYMKLEAQTFDAHAYFKIEPVQLDNGETTMSLFARRNLNQGGSYDVFLINHSLIFDSEKAREKLESNDGLVQRLVDLFGILPSHELVAGDPYKLKIDNVLKELWKNALFFPVKVNNGTELENETIWYLMDEIGMRIQHSSRPNARVFPIRFSQTREYYTVMFLTKKIKKNEKITRDFAENLVAVKKNSSWRDFFELPWVPQDFSTRRSVPSRPSEEFFTGFLSRKLDSTAWHSDQKKILSRFPSLSARSAGRMLRIHGNDVQFIGQFQKTHELVDDWWKADIIWLNKHFYDFSALSKRASAALINQFPFESCLTKKHLMAACAMEDPVTNNWFQLTYDMTYQLPEFIACYQQREKSRSHNVWIVKSLDSPRGKDMSITDDLNKIIRLIETGPKIISEYIPRPLLFFLSDSNKFVKFDLRYIIFVKSFRPVTAYCYSFFWVRLATNHFTMGNFEDADTHFPVYNNVEDPKVQSNEFARLMEVSYKGLKWPLMQGEIYSTIRKALEAASKNDPPRGVASNVQSRAMYGVDIMLRYDENNRVKPTILDFSSVSDFIHLCRPDTDFADIAFNALFLDVIHPTKLVKISPARERQ